MTNKEVIEYVQHTPHNINPVILKQKLEQQDFENRPDWNQNDPSAPDYVKNRTHYVEQVEEVVVERTAVPPFDNRGESMLFLANDISSWNGVDVNVILNDAVYNLTVYGNGSISEVGRPNRFEHPNDDNTPFTIIFEPDRLTVCLSGPPATQEPVLGITRIVEKSHPLDPKYLQCDLMFKVGCTGFAHPKFDPLQMTKPTIIRGSLEAVLEKLANGEIPVVKVQYMGIWDKKYTFPAAYGGEFICDTWLYNDAIFFTHDIPNVEGKMTTQITMFPDDLNAIEMMIYAGNIKTTPILIE